jgi:type IV secretion system protein VirD4
VARPHTTAALIRRRAELDQRTAGVASRLDVAEHASAAALKHRAAILRPSLIHLSRWERRRLPPTQVGVQIARLGWGWWGEQVWSSCEDATLRVGGPRTGKTLSLACHGLDAPGALITTSTRLDLAEMLHTARAGRGAVHVFNPAGLGGLASTVRWRILDGCQDYATAQRRASDLIPESSGEGERWDIQARRILALFLHAAAVDHRSMRDVMRWVYDTTPAGRDEVVDALMTVPGGGRDRAGAVRGFWATNDRTRTSITTTMAIPLAWMADDRARDLGDATPDTLSGDPGESSAGGAAGRGLVDIAGLVRRGETLHLIGHEDQGGLSPLIGALVAEIAHTARTLASHQPGGRLDPPVTMLLDEAALVCPVPLDRWSADMGGRGVTIHTSVQSLAQLRQRWGVDGAGAILANVACFIVFGGSPSSADLADISRLTGGAPDAGDRR